MTNYLEVLRLSSLGYSQRMIESMARCSRHTICDVLQAAKERDVPGRPSVQLLYLRRGL